MIHHRDCPRCGTRVGIPDNLWGQQVLCPSCHGTFVAEGNRPSDAPSEEVPEVPVIEPRERRPRRWEDENDDERRLAPLPDVLPGQPRTTAVTIVLLLTILIDLFFIAAQSVELALIAGVEKKRWALDTAERAYFRFGKNPNGDDPRVIAAWDAYERARGELEEADDRYQVSTNVTFGLGIANLILTIVGRILFVVWVYRAHLNLAFLDVRGLRFTSGWAVGWFFVPFANLIMPCLVLQEIWRASDPAAPPGRPSWWKKAPGSLLVGFFWLALVIAFLFDRVAFAANNSIKVWDANQLSFAGIVTLVAAAAGIAADGLNLAVVLAIRRRQVRKLALLRGESGNEEPANDN